MSDQQKIADAIKSALRDYDRDFSVLVNHAYDDQYIAEVTYQFGRYSPKHVFTFDCQVEDGECQMNFYEDCYEEITKENMFVFMFFEQTMLLDNPCDVE